MASQHAVSTQDATHRADVWITIVFTSLVLAPLPAHATTFENVAPAMGIVISPNSSGHSVGGGVSFLDANGDGLLDILTTTITVPPILFRQVSGGFVKDEFAVTSSSTLTTTTTTTFSCSRQTRMFCSEMMMASL